MTCKAAQNGYLVNQLFSSSDTTRKNNKINSCFVSTEGPKAKTNNICFRKFWKIFCKTILYMRTGSNPADINRFQNHTGILITSIFSSENNTVSRPDTLQVPGRQRYVVRRVLTQSAQRIILKKFKSIFKTFVNFLLPTQVVDFT